MASRVDACEVPVRGDPDYISGGVRIGGRGRKSGFRGKCSGCGFLMMAVQALPGWRDVSGGTGFALGPEVSLEQRRW